MTFYEEVEQVYADRGPYDWNPYSAASLLIDTFGHEMRWVQEENKWWLCSRTSRPGYWSREDREGAYARALAVCQVLGNRTGLATLQPRSVKNVLETAKPGLAARLKDFNSDPYILGCRNGVVHLRSGTFTEEVDPALLLTRSTNVSYLPKVPYDHWLDHLRVLTRTDVAYDSPGRQDVIDYLQLLVGASLVGAQPAHVAVYLHGDGRNGKGIFVDTLRRAVGDYGDVLDQTVLHARPDAHTTGIKDLMGKRFVVADEVTGQHKINTSLLKKLTGGGMVKGRGMRQDNVTWEPTHTLWLVSNDQPNLGLDQTEALWERFLIIQTGPTIPVDDRRDDTELRAWLWAENEGILRWAIEGATKLLRTGLPKRLPESMRLAREELRDDLSLIARFIAEECVAIEGWQEKEKDAEQGTQLKVFRTRLEMWAREEGLLGRYDKLPSHEVAQLLRRRGVTCSPGTGNRRWVRGWSLRPPYWEPEVEEQVTKKE